MNHTDRFSSKGVNKPKYIACHCHHLNMYIVMWMSLLSKKSKTLMLLLDTSINMFLHDNTYFVK